MIQQPSTPPRLAKPRALPPGVKADAVWGDHKWVVDGAEIEADRYRLRWWLEAESEKVLELPTFSASVDSIVEIAFIGLNPSRASENSSDNTLRRCWGFVRALGHIRLSMYNLFSARGTDPEVLLTYTGDDCRNTPYVAAEAQRIHAAGGLVIAAWGDLPSGQRRDGTRLAREDLRRLHDYIRIRDEEMVAALHGVPLHVLALTADGKRPRHPLMLPKTCKPTIWRPA